MAARVTHAEFLRLAARARTRSLRASRAGSAPVDGTGGGTSRPVSGANRGVPEGAPRMGRLERLLLDGLPPVPGLPPPEIDQPYGIPGRRFRYDVGWPALRIAVEVQGGVWSRGAHGRPENLERDAEKACLAALAGWTVFPVTARMVKRGLASVLLRRLLVERMMRPREVGRDLAPEDQPTTRSAEDSRDR